MRRVLAMCVRAFVGARIGLRIDVCMCAGVCGVWDVDRHPFIHCIVDVFRPPRSLTSNSKRAPWHSMDSCHLVSKSISLEVSFFLLCQRFNTLAGDDHQLSFFGTTLNTSENHGLIVNYRHFYGLQNGIINMPVSYILPTLFCHLCNVDQCVYCGHHEAYDLVCIAQIK